MRSQSIMAGAMTKVCRHSAAEEPIQLRRSCLLAVAVLLVVAVLPSIDIATTTQVMMDTTCSIVAVLATSHRCSPSMHDEFRIGFKTLVLTLQADAFKGVKVRRIDLADTYSYKDN